MQTKDFLGLALIFMALLGGIGITAWSQRAREIAFFFMTAGLVLTERMDINFLSREWYRGTTRGIEISLVDIAALSILISSLMVPRFRPRAYWPASLGFMGLVFVCGVVSVLSSSPQIFGVFELSKMLRAILFFIATALFVRSERELRILVLALCCTVSLEGVLALKHRLHLGLDRATGTLDHANSLSMYLCMTAPVLVAAFNTNWPKALRYFALAALGAAGIGIVLTLSRAGMPIFGFVVGGAMLLTMSWHITPRKIALASTGLLVIGVGVLMAWDKIVQRYSEDSIQEEMQGRGFESRGQYVDIAKEIVKDHRFGVGLNNWSYWVSKSYGKRVGIKTYQSYESIPKAILEAPEVYDLAPNHAPPAHNLGVLTLGEMGWPGLILFVLLWVRWLQMGSAFLWVRSSDAIKRMGPGLLFAVVGVFLQSLTEWVYRHTTILLTLHIILGALASLYYIKRHTKHLRAAETEVEDEPVRISRPQLVHARSYSVVALPLQEEPVRVWPSR